jgi:putative FmdB family regulatory protein
MPLYEYECESCAHRFERIQKFSDPLVDTCPSCGGPVRKLLSSPAIQFKGSGWYITDYPKKGSDSGGGAKKDSPAESTSDSSASSASTSTTDSTKKSNAKKSD